MGITITRGSQLVVNLSKTNQSKVSPISTRPMTFGAFHIPRREMFMIDRIHIIVSSIHLAAEVFAEPLASCDCLSEVKVHHVWKRPKAL
jgi:hypothetical protein